MEWEKAKTILIILLTLLNAGLFVMGADREKKYIMEQTDISAITEALAANDITLACDIPPENRPVRLINLTAAEWGYDYIVNAFFPDEAVIRTLESGSIIYRAESGGRAVTVTYAREGGYASELIYTEERARGDAPEDYIALFGKPLEGFTLRRAFEDENGKTFLFNDSVKDAAIFVSSAEVTFADGGATVRVRKMDYSGYVEGTHEIFRADEALLSFLHYKKDNIEGHVNIEAMEFGFGTEGAPAKNVKAKPYYRLFAQGIKEPFIVDAVMNTVLYSAD